MLRQANLSDMNIINIRSLAFNEVKVIRFARFGDSRGYFSEIYRNSDFSNNPDMAFIKDAKFLQCNESFSKAGTVRGLHFQWNPKIGKLVRTLFGRMVDLVLDVRIGSPSFGKIIAHDMPAKNAEYSEWIWVPPGFAHGNFYTQDSAIEYFCTGEYNPECEAGISPLSEDIEWPLCGLGLYQEFKNVINGNLLISKKDKDGFSIKSWKSDERSKNFIF